MNAPASQPPVPAIFRSGDGYRALLSWYDKELPQTSIPYESRMLDTSFGKTHVLVMGPEDAPPLFLFHGLNINALGIRRFWLHLARHFRVYAPDIIGQPGRSSGFRPSRDGDGYPQWTVEVLNALGLDQPNIMGISFGAWLVLKLGCYAPERIGKGVLFVPAGLAPVRMRTRIHLARRAVPYILSPTEQRLNKLITPLFSPGATPEPDLLSLMRICFQTVKQRPAPFKPMDRATLSGIKAPLLAMAAEHDLFYDVDLLVDMSRKALPEGALVEKIPGQGHIFFDPALEPVCERIARFFKEGV